MNEKPDTNLENSTYGTGQQIVEEPDSPTQLQKMHPKDEVPRQVATPAGQVWDLDSGEISKPEMVEISGRKINVSEFGEKGIGFLQEMYEEYLLAVQEAMRTTFRGYDEGGVNSALIVEEAKKYKHVLLQQLDPMKADSQDRVLRWTRDRTFEDWIDWSICTLRWRITYELDRRAFLGIISSMDAVLAKEALGECLVACEKFAALSEQKRLVAI